MCLTDRLTEASCFVFRVDLILSQDPNSYNLGTTVWDASIVLAKYFEKNSHRGEFSRTKVSGKKVVELGAGVSGLAGISVALMGARVVLTDITDPVLDLLRQNVANNVSPASLRLNQSASLCQSVGSISVHELDWSKASEHISKIHDIEVPVDYILAADCVYNEASVSVFLECIQQLSKDRTVCAVCNEFRSESVHAEFLIQFGKHFNIKKVPSNKMDKRYYHPLIHIYILKQKC